MGGVDVPAAGPPEAPAEPEEPELPSAVPALSGAAEESPLEASESLPASLILPGAVAGSLE